MLLKENAFGAIGSITVSAKWVLGRGSPGLASPGPLGRIDSMSSGAVLIIVKSAIPAAEKAGLSGLTPHELRHTAASLAVAAGANVKAVQQMLGHASAAMTLDVYAGLFADDLDGVADRLDRAFMKLNADRMRTARRPSQSNQGVLPFES